MIDKDFLYFVKNQQDLISRFNNKHLLIQNEVIVGVYNSQDEAYQAIINNQTKGVFIIQECSASPLKQRTSAFNNVDVSSRLLVHSSQFTVDSSQLTVACEL